MKAALPLNETARIETLERSGWLDSRSEQAYDDITLLAAQICGTPIAALGLIDGDRQWLKSKIGLEITEIGREYSFCAHTILQDDLLVVPDARRDARFADNPSVISDPGVRFYAGAPLITSEGHALGALCVADNMPRSLNEGQQLALQALSRQVMAHWQLSEKSRAMKELNAQLQRLSIRDELTALHNRRAFNIALHREIARAIRYHAPLSLVLLDIDGFKNYNDTFGHQGGDYVLQRVGTILPQHIEEMAVAARYGGEEFALILPDTSALQAREIAEEVRRDMEKTGWPLRGVTASFGIATTNSHLQDETALIAAADIALYASKNAGRNRVTHFETLS